MSQLLKLSYTEFQKKHPTLPPQLRAGLLLAIAGRVKWDGSNGQVFSQGAEKRRPYRVTFNEAGGWHCTCEYSLHSPASSGCADFYNHRALYVCKHIAAAALCLSVNTYPPAPVSLWDLLSDLIAAQHVPAPGEAWQIPSRPVKFVNKERDWRDVLRLATGRTYSLPLAAWVSNPAGHGIGQWVLKADARARYVEFIKKIGSTVTETGPQAQQMEVEL